MLKFTQNIFNELRLNLDLLPSDTDPKEILRVLKVWMIKYNEILSSPPFSDYHLIRKIQLNEEDYPVMYSTLHDEEFIHIKKVLNRYSFQDTESIARILSEILDKLYFFEMDEECPNCSNFGLLVWKEVNDNQMIFECRQCGFMGTLDGRTFQNVVPAKTIDLKRVNYI
ncbi:MULTISPECIES: hypothetical protein [Acinetobacter]|nr:MULTISPECIES: hypothetical protein [Acinetobacter]MBJ9955195.1 hypothetical protein [Acinetobacter baumannii]MBO3656357.1 hypothetical protein [Acinetobacter bereziniae]MCU4419445.1 hypothetical protein [Acinetobacter bereziniae]